MNSLPLRPDYARAGLLMFAACGALMIVERTIDGEGLLNYPYEPRTLAARILDVPSTICFLIGVLFLGICLLRWFASWATR